MRFQLIFIILYFIIASYLDNGSAATSEKARAAQVVELSQFIKKKTANSPYPTIVAGIYYNGGIRKIINVYVGDLNIDAINTP